MNFHYRYTTVKNRTLHIHDPNKYLPSLQFSSNKNGLAKNDSWLTVQQQGHLEFLFKSHKIPPP